MSTESSGPGYPGLSSSPVYGELTLVQRHTDLVNDI